MISNSKEIIETAISLITYYNKDKDGLDIDIEVLNGTQFTVKKGRTNKGNDYYVLSFVDKLIINAGTSTSKKYDSRILDLTRFKDGSATITIYQDFDEKPIITRSTRTCYIGNMAPTYGELITLIEDISGYELADMYNEYIP